VALGLAAALVVFNLTVMPRFVRHEAEVAMPDVRGKTRAEAERILESLALAVRDTVSRATFDVPRGVVIDQKPAAGSSIKPERGVRLVLSSGRDEIKVPGLAGQSLRFVRMNLLDEGYQVGDVVRVPSSDVSRDFVIASDPPAGTVVEPGQRIHLLVSDGPEGRAWIMPDLLGQDMRMTAEKLRFAGFQVVIDDDDPYGFRSRRVTATLPEPGEPVRSSATIHLMGG
jgi:beta-lactam-binding protein with PASTA domain